MTKMIQASFDKENKLNNVILVSYYVNNGHFLTECYPSCITLKELKEKINATKSLLEISDIQVRYIK